MIDSLTESGKVNQIDRSNPQTIKRNDFASSSKAKYVIKSPP